MRSRKRQAASQPIRREVRWFAIGAVVLLVVGMFWLRFSDLIQGKPVEFTAIVINKWQASYDSRLGGYQIQQLALQQAKQTLTCTVPAAAKVLWLQLEVGEPYLFTGTQTPSRCYVTDAVPFGG